MNRKNKLEEIDYLRALAFAAVVLQHAIAHYAYVPGLTAAGGISMAALLLASKFAVPLFVFITGMVLVYNYDGPFHYGDFIAKRVKDILLPYAVWTILYEARLLLYRPASLQDLWDLLRMLVTGTGSYHLWYIAMVFQFYLLFPLYRSVLGSVRGWLRGPSQAVFLLCAAAAGYVYWMTWVWPIHDAAQGWGIPVLTPLFTEYADRNSLYFIYYFVLGAAAGWAAERWREAVRRYSAWIYSAFGLLTSYLMYLVLTGPPSAPGLQVNLNELFLLRPWMAAYLIASILVLYHLGLRLREAAVPRVHSLLAGIGRYSYGAYLAHALLLTPAVQAADAVFGWLPIPLRTLIAAVLCTALSIGLTWLLARTPASGWLTGMRRIPWHKNSTQERGSKA